jgi:predicted DNA-binding protein (UPF0251 family)
MTPDQFTALAQLMRLRESPSREALRLVLVDGMSQYGAAQQAGIPSSNVTRQVASARRAIELARVVTQAAAPPQRPAA